MLPMNYRTGPHEWLANAGNTVEANQQRLPGLRKPSGWRRSRIRRCTHEETETPEHTARQTTRFSHLYEA